MNHIESCLNLFNLLSISPPAALVVWVVLALVATARVRVAQHEHEKGRWQRKLALDDNQRSITKPKNANTVSTESFRLSPSVHILRNISA